MTPFGPVVSYTCTPVGICTGMICSSGKSVVRAFDGLNGMQTAVPQHGLPAERGT